ncbi:MAG: TIGR03618 family F420-dependent PPOX class oxidoreductase [Acidimicrobiales bacterium]
MRFDPNDLPPSVIDFMVERHLATLSIVRPSGEPQVTPVGFTFEPETATARVITWATSYKARLVAENPGTIVSVCQVDGGRWLALTGPATVHDDKVERHEGVTRYAERYRQPKERDDRVVIRIDVQKMVGRVPDAE